MMAAAIMIVGIGATSVGILLPSLSGTPTGKYEGRENAARKVIGALATLQVVSYWENERFLEDFDAVSEAADLRIKDHNKPIDGTEPYRFAIKPLNPQTIVMTATANIDGLDSLTGFTWYSDDTGLSYGLCWTTENSKQPPALPMLEAQPLSNPPGADR
ncbi:MAG: type IV pilin-like G/H family protein [Leptolyngbyaceae cyanobacterium]